MLAFSGIFPKQLAILSPNFTHLLHDLVYARLQIFIHLSPYMTKLCHINSKFRWFFGHSCFTR